MLPVNTLLQGRYLIVEQIGRGGMGAVYKATDTRLRATVALKETLVGGDPVMIRAFEREAQLLAGLRHSALPKVSDHFIDESGQYLVMEFITGDDLATLLMRRGSPFPPPDVLRWTDRLLDALEYIHSRNPPVIHRDIKPQNMKLTERDEIILLDFGLAKGAAAQTRVTSTGSIFGYTPHYAPMEQIQGTGTDPRSDLYALAATMYHMLTGQPPVDALTRAAAKINDEPDPLLPADQVNANVSPGLAAVIMRAMAQNPNQRHPSATALRAALRDLNQVTGQLSINSSGETTQLSQPPMVIVAGPTEVQSAMPTAIPTALPVVPATGTTVTPPAAGPTMIQPAAEPTLITPATCTTVTPPAAPAAGSIAKKPWFWPAIGGALVAVIAMIALGAAGFGRGNPPPPPQPTSARAVVVAATEAPTVAQAPTQRIDATTIRQTVEAELTAVIAAQTADALKRSNDLATSRSLINSTDAAGTQTAIALTPTPTTPPEVPTAAAAPAPTSAPPSPKPTKAPSGPNPPPPPSPTPNPPPPSNSSGAVISSGHSGTLFTGTARKGQPIDPAKGNGGSCVQGRVLQSDGSTFTSFYVQVDNKSKTTPANHFYDTGNYNICGLGAGEWGVAVYAVNGKPTTADEQRRHQVILKLSGQPGEIFYVDFKGVGQVVPTEEPTAGPPTATSTPLPGPYDGAWRGRIDGTTAGGAEFHGSFRFEVEHNAVVHVALDGPSCLFETYPQFPNGKPLDDASFSLGGSPSNPRTGTDGSIEFTITGRFSSTTKAAGQVNATQNGGSCIVANWSASK